jgi:spore germination protein (amino acid permease)
MYQNSPIKPVDTSFLIAIITHILISWGYMGLIDVALLHLKHNAYLSIILALPLLLPFMGMIYDLASIFPGKPVTYVIEAAFGSWLGKLINLIHIFMIFGFLIRNFWESQLLVGNYFLNQIDVRILYLILAGMTLYLALHGIEAVGRLAAFMLIIPLVVIYALQFFNLSFVNLLNVRPLLEGSARGWFESGFDMLFIVIGITAAFPYLAFFNKPKSVLRSMLISAALTIPLFFFTIFGTIGAFGPEMTTRITWPAVEFFRIINLPILLLEQAGLFFVIIFNAIMFVLSAQGFFILGHLINTAFPAIKLKWATLAIGFITTIITFFLPQSTLAIKNFFQLSLRYIICSYYSIILLTWILVRIRYRRQSKKE